MSCGLQFINPRSLFLNNRNYCIAICYYYSIITVSLSVATTTAICCNCCITLYYYSITIFCNYLILSSK